MNIIQKTMSEKKVIEQEKWDNLEINSSDYYGGFVSIETNNTIEIRIEKKHATTVAKAIDPEYQKVIDQNTKLVEAKDNEMIEFAWWLLSKLGQYSDDKVAHFEGRYLEQWKKIKQ